MKYVDEFRDPKAVERLARAIHDTTHHPWTIMEVCGGQTHTIVRYGLDRLLPSCITLIHGPGCPVCVTSVEMIDIALELAACPDILFCSFGDMLRVPGSHGDLLGLKARGGAIHVIYSPLDAVELARSNPSREVVCFAVGFETTAPAQAMAVLEAKRLGLTNFSLLVAHVLVLPAMEAILVSPKNHVQGFLAAGHVCTVMGYEQYEALAKAYRVPIVVTGFEPLDILEGVHLVIQLLESGQEEVRNQYTRSVSRLGNPEARAVVQEVFEVVSQRWRGLGELPRSGLGLKPAYASYDALHRFSDRLGAVNEHSFHQEACQSGLVLQGQLKPSDCP